MRTSFNAMHRPCFALSVLAVLSMSGPVTAAQRFPSELVGPWDMGPKPCVLPLNQDADSPIRIRPAGIQNYEDDDELIHIKRISLRPLAWHVTTKNDIAPGVISRSIYVLYDDMLTVTDGRSTVEYRRCKAKTQH